MIKNGFYFYLQLNKEHFNQQAQVIISESTKNNRDVIYVQLIEPANLEFSGYTFEEAHLSVDAYYYTDRPDMPAEHLSIYFTSKEKADEKMVIRITNFHTDSVEIKFKKITISETGEKKALALSLPANSTIERIKLYITPYVKFYNTAREQFLNESDQLKNKISDDDYEIACLMKLLEDGSSSEDFISTKEKATNKINEIIKKIKRYETYTNNSQAGILRYWARLLNAIQEKKFLIEATVVLPKEHEATAQLAPLVLSQKSTTLPPAPIKGQTDSIEHVKHLLKQIRDIKASSNNEAEKIIAIEAIRHDLTSTLLALLFKHKNSQEINRLFELRETYLENIHSIEECFFTALEEADIEGVKILYPHLSKGIQAQHLSDFLQLIAKIITGTTNQNNYLLIADYLHNQNSTSYLMTLKYWDSFSVYASFEEKKEYILPGVFKHIQANDTKTFELLIRHGLIKHSFSFFVYANKNGTKIYVPFDIVQSIFVFFYENPNLRFIEILANNGFLNQKISLDESNVAQLDNIPTNPEKDPKLYNQCQEIQSLGYFELSIALFLCSNSGRQKSYLELCKYLIDKVTFIELLMGTATLLDAPDVISRQACLPNQQSDLMVFKNQKDLNRAIKTANGTSSTLNIFFYMSEEQKSNQVFQIIEKLLQYIKEKFFLLSENEQRQLIKDLKKAILLNPQKNEKLILLTLALNTLIETPNVHDYYNALELLHWNAERNKNNSIYILVDTVYSTLSPAIKDEMDQIPEYASLLGHIQSKKTILMIEGFVDIDLDSLDERIKQMSLEDMMLGIAELSNNGHIMAQQYAIMHEQTSFTLLGDRDSATTFATECTKDDLNSSVLKLIVLFYLSNGTTDSKAKQMHEKAERLFFHAREKFTLLDPDEQRDFIAHFRETKIKKFKEVRNFPIEMVALGLSTLINDLNAHDYYMQFQLLESHETLFCSQQYSKYLKTAAMIYSMMPEGLKNQIDSNREYRKLISRLQQQPSLTIADFHKVKTGDKLEDSIVPTKSYRK